MRYLTPRSHRSITLIWSALQEATLGAAVTSAFMIAAADILYGQGLVTHNAFASSMLSGAWTGAIAGAMRPFLPRRRIVAIMVTAVAFVFVWGARNLPGIVMSEVVLSDIYQLRLYFGLIFPSFVIACGLSGLISHYISTLMQQVQFPGLRSTNRPRLQDFADGV